MIGYDPKEEKYLAQWKQIQIAWKNGRMPQAMLFVGSLDCALIDFIRRFSKFVFVKWKQNLVVNVLIAEWLSALNIPI